MIIAQEFTKVRKGDSKSNTKIVTLKKDILKASGMELDDKVYMAVEEDDFGKKRIIIERVEN